MNKIKNVLCALLLLTLGDTLYSEWSNPRDQRPIKWGIIHGTLGLGSLLMTGLTYRNLSPSPAMSMRVFVGGLSIWSLASLLKAYDRLSNRSSYFKVDKAVDEKEYEQAQQKTNTRLKKVAEHGAWLGCFTMRGGR